LKTLLHFVLRIGFVLFCLLFFEVSYFSYILTHPDSDVPSDAVLIFMGNEKRIETGYKLANQGLAPCIVLSPAIDTLRCRFDRKYALKDTVSHIPEDQATTTFENALYISRIIMANQFKTVILVTSDYHMPRSLALLRLFLAGTGVRVHAHPVYGPSGAVAVNATLLKLVYNEMVEFWGSLFEYIDYLIRGKTAERPVKKSAFSLFLRSVVLLDVKPAW